MCYDKFKQFNDADKLFQQMMSSCKALNMIVEEPEWFELDFEGNTNMFNERLQ